jgi:predicted peptidase
MLTRRELIVRLGAACVGAHAALTRTGSSGLAQTKIAPGAPTAPERLALIDAFKRQSEGVETWFERHTHNSDVAMPYRLFRPKAAGRLPLVMYLHGSGGLGDDNEKQLGLGNIFGTRVWALPANQKRFPCYVVVPQTNRGWIRYDFSKDVAMMLPGLGDGSRLAIELVDRLLRELPIDEGRIYVTGQSMGGAGVWNVLANRPTMFAAAVVCCGSASTERGAEAVDTPLWSFHGDADRTVPVSVSRDRVAARRAAGGRPLYTEYAGVDHNSWEWAYTEPELAAWLFAQRRKH